MTKIPPWIFAKGLEKAPVEASSGVERAVLAAKIEALWKGSNFMAGVLLVATPYLTLVFQQVASPRTILIWAACVLLTVCIRIAIHRQFRRIPAESRDDTVWLNRLRIVLFVTALTVGVFPLVVLPQDATGQLVALTFFVGLSVPMGSQVRHSKLGKHSNLKRRRQTRHARRLISRTKQSRVFSRRQATICVNPCTQSRCSSLPCKKAGTGPMHAVWLIELGIPSMHLTNFSTRCWIFPSWMLALSLRAL
jgi:hypothetical protein